MKAKLMAFALIGMMFATTFAGIAGASGNVVSTLTDVIANDSVDAEDTPIYKDPNQPIDARVENLLSLMTLQEKIEQMGGEFPGEVQENMQGMMNTPENTRLGIPGFRFTDAGRGVRWGAATTFPVGIARGATWNPALEYVGGQVMGNETKAKGRNVLLAPCINLARDPHAGRTQEYYSEDTWLAGRMGVASIEGIQSQGAMAQVKHFAANNDEDQRFTKNSVVDPRTLNEIYLPHFKMAIQEANVATIMSAYNRLNGEYCGSNMQLLREILKGEWGFDGVVVSDWMGVTPWMVQMQIGWGLSQSIPIPNENFSGIPYMPTTESCIRAGLDVEMPYAILYRYPEPAALVQSGVIPEELVDDAIRRILRVKFEYGLFDNERTKNDKFVETVEHIAVTKQAEQEAIVLLKNENVLPFSINGIKTIAVIGPAANEVRLGDQGSSNAQPTSAITPLDGIKNYVGNRATVSYLDGSDTAAAAELAKKSDAVIVVVGRNYAEEAEGNDLETLALSGTQPALINAVGAVNKNCAVVLIAGTAVTMSEWIQNAPSILMAWYPGMEGGNAIASIMFGDVSPSGKLPLTFPKDETQLPPFKSEELDMVYSYYHGYRYFDKYNLEPQFPFGYGLSYTTFDISNMKIDKNVIGLNGKVRISVDVENTGNVAAAEVIQIYIGYEGSAVDRSVKDLKGFDKVFLQPGEKKTVTIEIAAENLSYYSAGGSKFVVEPIIYNVLVGASSRDIRETGSFRISENQAEVDAENQENAKTPGFEAVLAFAAIGAIALVLRKKRL